MSLFDARIRPAAELFGGSGDQIPESAASGLAREALRMIPAGVARLHNPFREDLIRYISLLTHLGF